MESNIEKNEELQWQLEQAIEEKEQAEKDNDTLEKRIVELERTVICIKHVFRVNFELIKNRLLELEAKQNE